MNAGGQVRDQRRTRIGLRTLEVVHARDDAGKSFFIKVNGAPVFMKGANWIPADSFVPRMTDDRYRFLLQSAADAHMNMVRVWGGGIYENDRFYELCDELGLLVWQDFMFACSMYPGDPAFVENVRHEAQENVRRLRNHPSLALWAGNNENESAWKSWGWPAKFHLSKKAQDTIWSDYKKMFHELLPGIVAAEDPGRFYSRSSPSANEDRVPANRMGWGDMHYWGVWHAENPYTSYSDNISRFMSEYGFQVVSRAVVGGALHRARHRLGHRQPGDAVAPEAPARERAHPHVSGSRLSAAQGFRFVLVCPAGVAGDCHQVRRRGAPARDGTQLGEPVLATRRLLARRLVVGD